MGPLLTPARRERVALVGLVLAVLLPFSGRAFHIDDAFFIDVAETIRRDPLRPYSGAAALDDNDRRVFDLRGTAPNTFETLSHPPLVPYAIAAVAAATGDVRERAQHLAFLVFPALAVWSLYGLARRFTARPFLATLLLAVSPVFLVSSQSVMTDVPALALSLAALHLFVSGLDEGRTGRLVLAGLVGGLAMLARYVALGLVPLGLVYAVSAPRGRRRSLVALAAAAALLGLWVVQNWAAYGTVHVLAAARHYLDYYGATPFAGTPLLVKAVSDLVAFAAVGLPAALLVPPGGWRRFSRRLVPCGVVALLACAWDPAGIVRFAGHGPWERGALVVGLAAGLALLVGAASADARSADGRFLLLWLAGGVAGTVLLLPFGAARYTLTFLPPVALLVAGAPGTKPGRLSWPARAGAAVSLALAVLLSVADEDFADAYRSFARRTPAPAAGGETWFIGDWGLRFYRTRAGHRYLPSTDERPAVGDVVVVPRVAANHPMARGLSGRVALLDAVSPRGRVPLRLLSRDARAGFYSHGWGLLPFAVSWTPVEVFEVYRVAAPR